MASFSAWQIWRTIRERSSCFSYLWNAFRIGRIINCLCKASDIDIPFSAASLLSENHSIHFFDPILRDLLLAEWNQDFGSLSLIFCRIIKIAAVRLVPSEMKIIVSSVISPQLRAPEESPFTRLFMVW